MSKSHLREIVDLQQRGIAKGIASICSANPWVIDACMKHAVAGERPLLLESTCNQVNQFGGYTGQTPAQFAAAARSRAEELGLPPAQLILGGDHLGPNPWQDEPAAQAMAKAVRLVQDYVRAGYTKIHLDASMKCGGDDPDQPLAKEISAARAAEMALAAEETAVELGLAPNSLLYVVGTEVPIPGGSQEKEEALQVTAPEDVAETLAVSRDAFRAKGLDEAWQNVIAVVVQPGVEFGDDNLFQYDRQKAEPLSRFIRRQAGLVYEAHSTDYQSPQALRQLVVDHFALLKVGPALTFALREAVYALAEIETELYAADPAVNLSYMRDVLEGAMLQNPEHWQKHYHGTAEEQYFARHYSFSDRVRYYWPQSLVQVGLMRLLQNLGKRPLPMSLLSQYLPRQYRRVRAGVLAPLPQEIINDKITAVLDDYAFACGDKDALGPR